MEVSWKPVALNRVEKANEILRSLQGWRMEFSF